MLTVSKYKKPILLKCHADVMSIVKVSYSIWRNYIIYNNNKLFQTFNNYYQIKQCISVLSLSAKRHFTDLRETSKQLNRSGERKLLFLLCEDLTLNLKVDDFITSVCLKSFSLSSVLSKR